MVSGLAFIQAKLGYPETVPKRIFSQVTPHLGAIPYFRHMT